MKMGNKHFICFAFFALSLFLMPISLPAQEVVVDTSSFNALEFSMQKRYRPVNEPFVSERFLDNTFLRLSAGSCGLFPNSASSYSQGPVASVYIGKMFGPLNSVSVGASVSEFRRNVDGVRVWRGGVGFSHSFNFSSYFYGYSPSRILSISTLEGAELGLVRAKGEYGAAMLLNVGLDMRAQIAREIELFFAPKILFGNDGLDKYPSPQNCHFGYGFDFGILAHFNRHREDSGEKESFSSWFAKDAFISFSGGAQFQISELVGKTAGYLPSTRESAALSYGRRLSGPLSLRLSAFYGRDIWKRFNDGRSLNCYYGGGRAELMFDTLHWWKRSRPVFSLPILLGPEAGLLWKPDEGYTIRRIYLGLTGGLQMRFNIARHFGLFIEPRMSLVPYSWKTRSGNVLVSSMTTWYDTLFSLQLGVNIPLQ